MHFIWNFLGAAAHWLYDHGQLRTANFLLEACRLTGGVDSWLLDFQGHIARQQGLTRKAIRKFEAGLELDPGNTRARQRLAYCFARIGEVEQATEQARRLLLSGAAPAGFAQALGEALLDGGIDHAKALEWFQLAAERDSEWEQPRLCVAHCLLNMGQTDDALSLYQELASTTREPWIVGAATMGVAKALHDLGRIEEGLTVARSLVQQAEELRLPARESEEARAVVGWLEDESPMA